ncbi:helix-turn-helix transcriptional regulator [Xylophilus sp. GOD-11R]|uniref:S24 family peptidase n=1 Tax=Xylophilus sp. GOD-11R TaxID=3089814 RepID=UPI00298CC019|nr:S24 family peptidase [Xylophilus sp. GOD-11R]WPB58611.1 S24 family peptidase [Xylophilus sp. GOD-11R]
MHPTAARLYEAAQTLRQTTGQSAVAKLLNESPQTVKNWETRGVSKAGAIKAQTAIGCSATWLTSGAGAMGAGSAVYERPTGSLDVDTTKVRHVYVVGKGSGGMAERMWTDGDYPVGATDSCAEIATSDPHAFLVEVDGSSMVPRYNPGEFALVEPGTEPELEDDVLVRLATGQTMIKRLLSRRAGWRFGSYNVAETLHYELADVTWVYYIAHPVPRRKIKTRC